MNKKEKQRIAKAEAKGMKTLDLMSSSTAVDLWIVRGRWEWAGDEFTGTNADIALCSIDYWRSYQCNLPPRQAHLPILQFHV
jgi:hypothetical protein